MPTSWPQRLPHRSSPTRLYCAARPATLSNRHVHLLSAPPGKNHYRGRNSSLWTRGNLRAERNERNQREQYDNESFHFVSQIPILGLVPLPTMPELWKDWSTQKDLHLLENRYGPQKYTSTPPRGGCRAPLDPPRSSWGAPPPQTPGPGLRTKYAKIQNRNNGICLLFVAKKRQMHFEGPLKVF